MRGLTIVLLILASGNSSALAGRVIFDPPLREVDPSIDPLTTFEVTISATRLESFDSFSVVIGSQDLVIFDQLWVFDPGLPPVACTGTPCYWRDSAGWKASHGPRIEGTTLAPRSVSCDASDSLGGSTTLGRTPRMRYRCVHDD